MEYKIDGLTKKQVALLEVMWSMDDIEQVQSFVKSLHPKDRAEAHGLMTLLVHEALEEMMPAFEEAGFPEVQDIIERVR